MRPDRPALLGLVCWVLIVGNMATIYTTMKRMGSAAFATSLEGFPYAPGVAETILFGTMALFIISAICLYEGQGWARYIYFVTALAYFVHNFLTVSHENAAASHLNTAGSHLKIHLALAVFALKLLGFAASVAIVYLPDVRRYFHPPLYVDE